MTSNNVAPDSTADMTTSHSTRIGLLADLHWTPAEAEEIHQLLDDALAHFHDANVEHIVVLGDLIVEGDTSTETRKRFHSLVERIRDNADVPVTVLRGNHDVTTADGQAVTDLSFEPRNGTIFFQGENPAVYGEEDVTSITP